MEAIFINVAGFRIKVCFRTTPVTGNINFIQEKLKADILGYYKHYRSFETKDNSGRADYYIEFVDKLKPELAVHWEKHKKIYYIFYEEVRKNKIRSSIEISIFQFQLLLRQILYRLLLDNKGLILHASAAMIGEGVSLFLGGPGAGKSTIISLLGKEHKLLADDSVLLKKDDRFYFYQPPFLEKMWKIKKRKKRYTLKRIFFLRKSSSFKIEKLEDGEDILHKIVKNTFVEKEDLRRQMKTILELVTDLNKFYQLYFAKDEKKLADLFENLE